MEFGGCRADVLADEILTFLQSNLDFNICHNPGKKLNLAPTKLHSKCKAVFLGDIFHIY